MLKEIKNADSVNQLITKINDVSAEWDSTVGPCNTLKETCLKAAGLDKTKGANITHVVLGLCIASINDAQMSLDDLKNQFKFTEKKPYITIGAFQKYVDLSQNLPDWITSYFDAVANLEDIANKI